MRDVGGPDFCSGVIAERARIAADMRRRARELRAAVGEMKAGPTPEELDDGRRRVERRTVDIADLFPVQDVRKMTERYLREGYGVVASVYVSAMLYQAEVFDKYAEDLERTPT